jgi:hypothetical protein
MEERKGWGGGRTASVGRLDLGREGRERKKRRGRGKVRGMGKEKEIDRKLL